MKTNEFFIMLWLNYTGRPVPVVVSEHQRYRTEKFDRNYYLRQLFGPCTERECRSAVKRELFSGVIQ